MKPRKYDYHLFAAFAKILYPWSIHVMIWKFLTSLISPSWKTWNPRKRKKIPEKNYLLNLWIVQGAVRIAEKQLVCDAMIKPETIWRSASEIQFRFAATDFFTSRVCLGFYKILQTRLASRLSSRRTLHQVIRREYRERSRDLLVYVAQRRTIRYFIRTGIEARGCSRCPAFVLCRAFSSGRMVSLKFNARLVRGSPASPLLRSRDAGIHLVK